MTYLFNTLNFDSVSESTEDKDLVKGLQNNECAVNSFSATKDFQSENNLYIEADTTAPEILLPILEDAIAWEDLKGNETEINDFLVEANDFIKNNLSSSDLGNLFPQETY